MNLLLDSHALLWALSDPGKLSRPVLEALEEPANIVAFSAASVWELELKASKGKLTLPPNWIATAVETGFVEWKIDSAHALASTRLPWHHADPFDRLLVAQAKATGFTLVTRVSTLTC